MESTYIERPQETTQAPPQPSSAERLQRELDILTDVAAALSSSLDLGDILNVILTGATAGQGLGYNRTFLFLYDQDQNKLCGHLATGPSSAEEAGAIWRELDQERMSLEEMLDSQRGDDNGAVDSITDLIAGLEISLDTPSLIGSACARGRRINLRAQDELDPVTAAFADRLGTRDMAVVPLISKDNLMGLLTADNLITGNAITDPDVTLLQSLADQAAVAMERARLYDTQIARSEELERANQLLAETQDQIIKIEKMSVIGELTSAIAHELRNPLTVVGGFANLMLKSEIADEQRQYLSIISSEIKRAESVLDHVLDFSRASKGKSEVLDFSALVERSVRLLVGRVRRPHLRVNLAESERSLPVYGNADQLAHAVYQFLKAIAEDMAAPCEAEIACSAREGMAAMTVGLVCSNESESAARAALERIFSGSRTSQRLTVLVAGETIRYHGGRYGAAFERNEAPSLYIELPLAEDPCYG